MRRTRLCTILGIDYPIIQGGMGGVSSPELVAAVSNAGGLGLLSGIVLVDALGEQVRRVRELTSRPFGINVPMFVARIGDLGGLLQLLEREEVPVVVTAAGNPVPVVTNLRQAGFTVMHVVGSVRAALRAEEAGAQAIIASGFEAGGLLGREQVTTMALVPAVVDAVEVPVVAAGGIGDARGVVAAFALGAEGVQIGTRFLASDECSAPERHKEAVVAASDIDTEVVALPFGHGRLLKLEVYGGAPDTDLYSRYASGQISGIVREVKSAGEIVAGMVTGYGKVVASLIE